MHLVSVLMRDTVEILSMDFIRVGSSGLCCCVSSVSKQRTISEYAISLANHIGPQLLRRF